MTRPTAGNPPGSRGTGYQTEINRTLREHLQQQAPPLTEERLRQVLREELHEA